MTDSTFEPAAIAAGGAQSGQAIPQAETRAAAGPPAAYKTGFALLATGLVLALANFMAVLDTTIANVSVPHIAGGLAVSPSQGTWVITSYQVAEAITVPLTGWLAQRFGAVRVFTTAMLGFAIMSALCGLAPSLSLLVLFRIGQGLCGGPMIPLSQALLLRVFPPQQAAQAIGLWSMTTVVAPIAGPILGGVICDNVGWPWAFYINVPVAIAGAFIAMRLLSDIKDQTVRRPFDLVGLLLLVLWIGCMQFVLDKGQELDWFNSPLVRNLSLTAVVGFIAFLIWELTAEDPIVNLKLFRIPSFAVAAMTMSLVFGAFFSSVVLIPLWLQTNLNYTATWAGYVGGFTGVLAVVMSPVVARLLQSGRFDARGLISFGVFWQAFTMLWRTHFTSSADFWSLALPQFLQGFGMPFFFIPLMALGTGALAQKDVPAGAGLINFMRTTAGAIGTSLATTAWADATTKNRVQLVGRLNDAPGTLDAMQRQGLNPDQALRQLDGLVQGQSVMLATNQLFLTIALVMAFAASAVWLAPKPPKRLQAGGGH